MSEIDEELGLMQRTSRGDSAAFRTLADRHLQKILAFSYQSLRDRSEAEDVAQETFLRLWKDAGRYEPVATLSAWLHRIAHNLCIDRLRKRRERALEENDEPAAGAEPASLLAEKQEVSAVDKLIEGLPERQRLALTLVFLQELTNIEAAEIMQVSVEALESLLARGRKTMREKLQAVRTEEAPP